MDSIHQQAKHPRGSSPPQEPAHTPTQFTRSRQLQMVELNPVPELAKKDAGPEVVA